MLFHSSNFWGFWNQNMQMFSLFLKTMFFVIFLIFRHSYLKVLGQHNPLKKQRRFLSICTLKMQDLSLNNTTEIVNCGYKHNWNIRILKTPYFLYWIVLTPPSSILNDIEKTHYFLFIFKLIWHGIHLKTSRGSLHSCFKNAGSLSPMKF